ncbi:MAG: hypothetical protein IIY23_04325 [Erysipelotrichaceae bacterium]|nr:hypothetical protein [Erysipelotrichaceae bacterium]
MTEWIRYLLTSSASRDKTIFTIWASGRISTGEAIKRFKLSNNMPYYVNIEPDEFICWMNSLGYRRNNKNG